ncbi:uncharacterized protein BDR25DRAFT_236701, partial [Lindgomyces ingoldianus]
NWTWEVSGWTAGCGRKTRSHDFNVTIASVHSDGTEIAGVKAYCSGQENRVLSGM